MRKKWRASSEISSLSTTESPRWPSSVGRVIIVLSTAAAVETLHVASWRRDDRAVVGDYCATIVLITIGALTKTTGPGGWPYILRDSGAAFKLYKVACTATTGVEYIIKRVVLTFSVRQRSGLVDGDS